MTKSEEWDKQENPRRRFNPLGFKTVAIGLVVFMTIMFAYHIWR